MSHGVWFVQLQIIIEPWNSIVSVHAVCMINRHSSVYSLISADSALNNSVTVFQASIPYTIIFDRMAKAIYMPEGG